MKNKKKIAAICILLAAIIALTVALTLMFVPKKISSLISVEDIEKIVMMESNYNYNEETQNSEDATWELDEEQTQRFIKEMKSTKYKNRYEDIKEDPAYKFHIYYKGGEAVFFDRLKYGKIKDGKRVILKKIILPTTNNFSDIVLKK